MHTRIQLAQSFVVAVRHISVNQQLPEVTIERRGKMGEDIWCVKHWDRCLGKDGKWHDEMLPSSRTEKFITATRFELDTAFDLARDALDGLKVEMSTHGQQLFSYLHPASEQTVKVPTDWVTAEELAKEDNASN